MSTSHQRPAEGLLHPHAYPKIDPELQRILGQKSPEFILDWIGMMNRWTRQAKRLAKHKIQVSN